MREKKMKAIMKKMQGLALDLAELGYSFSERDTEIVLIDDMREVKTIKEGSVSYGILCGFDDDTDVVARLYERCRPANGEADATHGLPRR